MNKINNVIAFFVIGFLLVPCSGYAASVTEEVRSSIDKIINVLKDQSLKSPENREERRIKIRTILNERFSFKEMAKRSLGRYWKKRSDQEKEEFVKLFGNMLENSYIGKIEKYTNEKILYVKEINGKKKSIVKTKIITRRDKEIPVHYRLFKNKEGIWKIYDVVIEGVSLIRNYRTQFNQIITSSSYEGVLKLIKSKLEQQKA